MKTRFCTIILLWITVLLTLHAVESPSNKHPAVPIYFTPETAGPDFFVQGEYEGPLGKGKLGAQIIATDPGEFHAVFLNGGLTGSGWDTMSRVDVDGKAENGKAIFTGVWQATIENGVLTGKTKTGESFELKRIVRHSPTEGAKPPAGAVVLFDGSNADAWNNGKMDERKLLACPTTSKQKFNNFTLHVEFIIPFQPGAAYGVRGNSGVYLQDRYEIQILDSFGRPLNPHECGVIYCLNLPRYNMSYPPLQWQTYDIDFQAARFDEAGKKIRNAIVTVKHNGVMIHETQEILRLTGGHGITTESIEGGPFKLQGHGSPVFFRNIWVVEKK